jgi:ABC-type uncharacterized transport system permease subunit
VIFFPSWMRPVLGLFLGLCAAMLLVLAVGENPFFVLEVIVKSSFLSRYDLGTTLYYTTALIFTGLSVSMAFKAGLFNIGAEGQLVMGALGVALAAASFPGLPAPLALLVSLLFAWAFGGFWGWIAGWLRARRGSHEVINTIMLNFVAAALASWLVTRHMANHASQSPETHPVPSAFFLRGWDPVARFFEDAPVSLVFPLAVLVAVAIWFLQQKTLLGYELRVTGENPEAARVAGIRVERVQQWAMFLAGALAGMVALNEISGASGKMRLGFSPDFGFTGIAVALLARNHPLGILATAFLFGLLHKGAADLDIETEFVNRDISFVIQALVILGVSIALSFRRRGK